MAATALSRFPLAVRAGSHEIVVRPLQKEDEPELLAFFRRLPVDERRMLKHDVTDAKVVKAWCAEIDMERVLPLVALQGKRIVGDATLHRAPAGWSRHVGHLRVTIDPALRRGGLGRALLRELIETAAGLGVAVVDAEMLAEQKAAIHLFDELGFHCIATLPQHALDLTDQPHDLVVLSKMLTPVERLSPDATKSSEEVDEGGAG